MSSSSEWLATIAPWLTESRKTSPISSPLGAHGLLETPFYRLAVESLVVLWAEQRHGHELVAAEPRDHVALPEGRAQDVGGGDQQPVALGVPQLVVDALEAVDVEVHEQHLPLGALGAASHLVDPREEAAPVEQARQLVDVGEAAQELLQLLVGGDAVADRQAEPAPPDVHDPRGDLHRHALPVAGDVHGLVGERPRVGQRLRALAHLVPRLGGEHVVGGHGEELGPRVAESQARGLVDLDDLPGPAVVLEPVDEDHVAAGVEERPVAALALELFRVGRVERLQRVVQLRAPREHGEDHEAEQQEAEHRAHGVGGEPLRQRHDGRGPHEDEFRPSLHAAAPRGAARSRSCMIRTLT